MQSLEAESNMSSGKDKIPVDTSWVEYKNMWVLRIDEPATV
jgi:hypothetical protein